MSSLFLFSMSVFLHHDASLSGSIWDCVYWGWVELRWRLLNSTKLLNKLKHPKENSIMIWFFSDKKNVCQDQIYNKQNNRWMSLRMSPKWLKPSFLRQYGVRCGLRRRHAPALLWGQVKGQHQHLPRGHEADSIAGGRSWVWQQDSVLCLVSNRFMAWPVPFYFCTIYPLWSYILSG